VIGCRRRFGTRGTGDISIVLQPHGHEVVSTDLIDRGYGQGGLDFSIAENTASQDDRHEPAVHPRRGVSSHAASLDIEYVAFLHKAHWLNAAVRGVMVESVWCPTRCYLLQWRPDFKNQGAPTMDCNWYVFERASIRGRSWTSFVLPRPTDQRQQVLAFLPESGQVS
jgi:hypothetical protein